MKRRQCLVDLSAHTSRVQEREDVSPGRAHRAEVAQCKYSECFTHYHSPCHGGHVDLGAAPCHVWLTQAARWSSDAWSENIWWKSWNFPNFVAGASPRLPGKHLESHLSFSKFGFWWGTTTLPSLQYHKTNTILHNDYKEDNIYLKEH